MSTTHPTTKPSLLQDLSNLTSQADTTLTSLRHHHHRIATLITAEQADLAFAARFNAPLTSKNLPVWKTQIDALARAMEICNAYRATLTQIEKTVVDMGKWIDDGDLRVDMVDLEGGRRTAFREKKGFLEKMRMVEGECGVRFLGGGKVDGGEGGRFFVYD
ncbi:hypothetical protein T440DRAFT_448028 [Plenodomus tracheiphilus IPT5]|uniref:Uncharacterized protein n=1 Tax=Plenodomus tracheiphilus IPT5 TaxID=1408161 RepID=A0A6A7B822_9PLEO|nr:hypothetical protein T440DRAFT_448028 [Plenodomus tracheiphilus IPT5]